MPTPDTKFIITGGTVIDGTGGEPIAAAVVVEDGRIREIGMIEAEDMPRLDASGMYVTPGFIDIHSHSDFTLLVAPRAVSHRSKAASHDGFLLNAPGPWLPFSKINNSAGTPLATNWR